jgi:hypothetical protein
MEELDLGIFVVPTIALTLVILAYMYFAKRVSDRGEYKKFIVAVAVISYALNFVWELAQGPLYEGFEYDVEHISFCALASVADMLMVFILLFAFALIYKDVYWMRNWGWKRIASLVLIGFFGAILAEVWHTARGDWAYADAMPILPVAEVGISPVLQFTLLPWLIFMISKKFIKEK